MPRNTQIVKACVTLNLGHDFRPTTRITQVFSNLQIDEIVSCLRTHVQEDAQAICAMYDRLSRPLQQVVNIDILIAAAHCRDPHKVAGFICESFSRVKAMETQMIAAEAAPGIMRDASKRAKRKDGFQYSKMVLSTTGVIPLPKNQTTNNYVVGNKIDQSKTVNAVVNVPSHHEVINDVGQIFSKLNENSKVKTLESGGGDSADV